MNINLLHFDGEPNVQEEQYAKDQHSYILVSVAYRTYPTEYLEHQPRHNNSILFKALWQIYKDKMQTQEKETLQIELSFHFPDRKKKRFHFSWREFQQYRQCESPNPKEEKDNPSILKDYLSLTKDPF